MNYRLMTLIAIVPAAATMLISPALAKTDYCQYSESKRFLEVHLFGETYGSQDDERRYKSGFASIYKTLKMGDRLKIIVHSKGQMKDIEVCFPGCPEVSFLKGLTADCSVEIARKAKAQLKKKVTQIVVGSINQAGEPYKILDQLKTLDEYYSNRPTSESYVFNSTVPYGVDVDSKASLDKAFVELVQSNSLAGIKVPDVKFVNINPSKSLGSLWSDLKLDGKEGLDFEVENVVLD